MRLAVDPRDGPASGARLDSVPDAGYARTGDRVAPIAWGRQLAEHIPGARMVELDGDAHPPQFGGDTELVLSTMEEFITGHQRAGAPTERVLSTVLFTDIVDSTASAATMGDKAWRQVPGSPRLDFPQYRCRLRRPLCERHGDGVLATFDAPSRGLRCADTLRAALAEAGIAIRAGVHTGEVELRGDDVAGIGVHIAARVAALAGSGELLASRTVRDLTAGRGTRSPAAEHTPSKASPTNGNSSP